MMLCRRGSRFRPTPVRIGRAGCATAGLTGRPEKINAFLKMFSGYDILELCRTGITALERGGKHPHMQKPPQEVRAAQLPLPGTHCPQDEE